jgi:hypothetical protein
MLDLNYIAHRPTQLLSQCQTVLALPFDSGAAALVVQTDPGVYRC